MGYTHYWTFKPIKRGETAKINKAYKMAIRKCQELLVYWNEMHAYEPNMRLAGYAAHVKPGLYGGLNFNGAREMAHENFLIREHYKQNLERDYFGFCKTVRKPYDTVVVACLVILKHYLGDQISVASDGSLSDWAPGTGLVQAFLNNPNIKNPIKAQNGQNMEAI